MSHFYIRCKQTVQKKKKEKGKHRDSKSLIVNTDFWLLCMRMSFFLEVIFCKLLCFELFNLLIYFVYRVTFLRWVTPRFSYARSLLFWSVWRTHNLNCIQIVSHYLIFPIHTYVKRRNFAALLRVQDTRTFCCTARFQCLFLIKALKKIIHLHRRRLNCLGRCKCWRCIGSNDKQTVK